MATIKPKYTPKPQPKFDPSNAGFFTFGRFDNAKADYQEVIDKKEYVSFGKNNDFPQEVIRLYETASPLHTALVDKTAQMIAGGGLVQELLVESFTEKLFVENRFSNDTLEDIAEKLAFDIALFNGFYLQIIFDESGERIAQIEHLPFQNVRAEKSIDDVIRGYYVSRDWLNVKKPENKEQRYPAFDPAFAKNDGDECKSQILAVRVYTPGMTYYPLPSYKACIDSIKTNYDLNNYNLKSIQNGFNAGTIIINKGIYTPEEQRELHSDIKRKYTGSDEANDFIMIFAPTPDSVPEIQSVDNKFTEGRFLALKESIIADIIEGHKASSQVAGKETAGKLGNRQEIKEQHDIFNSTVIKPLQKKIEDTFNWLGEVNGLKSEFRLADYNFLEFANAEQVDDSQAVLNALNSLSQTVATKVLESMTEDEIRGLVGLGAKETAPTAEPQPNIEQTPAA